MTSYAQRASYAAKRGDFEAAAALYDKAYRLAGMTGNYSRETYFKERLIEMDYLACKAALEAEFA